LDGDIDDILGERDGAVCPIWLGLSIPPPYDGSFGWFPICNDARSSNKLLSTLLGEGDICVDDIATAPADSGINVVGWEETGPLGERATLN
jgi:hypothetical protein